MGSLFLWDTKLDEAVRQFNRYNRLQLRVDDPAVAALRTGGIFSTTDPESFVAALRQSFRLRPVAQETPDGTPTILLLGPALGQSATSEERKDP